MFADELARIPLVLVLIAAVFGDLRARRIPNRLAIAGLLGGAGVRVCLALSAGADWLDVLIHTLPQTMLGVLAGFACLFPLFLVRAMGGGDVKLMAVVGAFLGPQATFSAVLYTLIVGGMLSLAAALCTGTLRRVLRNLKLIAVVTASAGKSGLAFGDVATTGRLPYALAIAAGTAIEVWLTQWPQGL